MPASFNARPHPSTGHEESPGPESGSPGPVSVLHWIPDLSPAQCLLREEKADTKQLSWKNNLLATLRRKRQAPLLTANRAGGNVAQLVEGLPSTHELWVLSTAPSKTRHGGIPLQPQGSGC